MTFPGLVRANNLSDIVDTGQAWNNLGNSIEASISSTNYVSLLIHADGSNGSTAIADSSPFPKTITASGNAQINTTISKFGTGSLLFDGSGDYVRVENDAALNLSSSDFTIDFWLYPTTTAGTAQLIVKRVSTAFIAPIAIQRSTNTIKVFASSNGSTYDITNNVTIGTITSNAWHHIAFVRSKNLFYGFVNGTRTFVAESSAGVLTDTSPLFIGGDTNGNYFTGNIDEIRIVKGLALYTESFTPPTSAYSNTIIERNFSIVGRDISALYNVRSTSVRDFIRIKGLVSPAQPRITVAANNTASGVARRDLAMPKLAPTTSGNYFFSSGITLSGVSTRINGTNALSISTSPFSGSTATAPLLFAELRPQTNWRITEPMVSGTIATPELAIPFETNDFVLYMKAGQN